MTNFARILKGALKDEVIIPPLRAVLTAPRFDGFTVEIPDFHPRSPDGWFHPSTHPLWPERLLWFYINNPDDFLDTDLDTDGTLATTQGTFWHAFIQHVMLMHDMVLEMTPQAAHTWDKVEYFVSDPIVMSRGAMDGVLNPDVLNIDEPIGLELKTMRSAKLSTCPKGGAKDPSRVEWLKTKCPEYYAQAMEYLRMSGYSEQRFLFMGLEYPFPMVEISVPYDYSTAMLTVEKYRRVRQAVADGDLPDPCCEPRSATSRSCQARAVCPVAGGTMRQGFTTPFIA